MPFGRFGRSLAIVMAFALFHASIPRVASADTAPPARQEQPAKPAPLTEEELAQMRLGEMETPQLQKFQAGMPVPLMVIIGLSIVAVITFIALVVLPEKESPSTPDGYPHNTKAPEVAPQKKAVVVAEVEGLKQDAQANPALEKFAAGR